MIIRILLLGGLAAVGWLVFLRRNRLPVHIFVVFLLLGAAALAVVFPESTNDIANFVGVGRGADLILYVMGVVVLFTLLHYYTKFVELERKLTEVVRELAILRAEAERTERAARPDEPPVVRER